MLVKVRSGPVWVVVVVRWWWFGLVGGGGEGMVVPIGCCWWWWRCGGSEVLVVDWVVVVRIWVVVKSGFTACRHQAGLGSCCCRFDLPAPARERARMCVYVCVTSYWRLKAGDVLCWVEG